MKMPYSFNKPYFSVLLLSVIAMICGCKGGCKDGDCAGDQLFGIYTETPPISVTFDFDAFIGIFSGGGSITEFSDDPSQLKEGTISKKTTLTVDAANLQWAGWYIQYGPNGSPESEDIDMSAYKDGQLMFWVKSPIILEVGIRSGDIPTGFEKSKILLTQFPSFQADNTWHHVCIPISDFMALEPKLNLKFIKVLFSIAANNLSGGTNGAQTFWIDDIRWESRCNTSYKDCQ